MFNLAKCQSCGCNFNKKTGKDAMRAIILYNVIVFAIVFVAALVFRLSQ